MGMRACVCVCKRVTAQFGRRIKQRRVVPGLRLLCFRRLLYVVQHF